MKYSIQLALLFLLTSCGASSVASLEKALDRLDFDDDEQGCLRLEATFDLNPIPLVTSNAEIMYKKQKGDSLDC